MPTILDSHLIPHYIRGIFDGDGWISWNNNYSEFGFGMGFDILNYIKNIFENNVNIKEYGIKPYKKIFRYRITSKKEIMKILDYIYKDANVYLDRKHDRYKEFCRLNSKLLKG